jgi:hypothetical protein
MTVEEAMLQDQVRELKLQVMNLRTKNKILSERVGKLETIVAQKEEILSHNIARPDPVIGDGPAADSLRARILKDRG